jgi:hypothetical protein
MNQSRLPSSWINGINLMLLKLYWTTHYQIINGSYTDNQDRLETPYHVLLLFERYIQLADKNWE